MNLYQEMKPLIWAMKIVGVLPIQINSGSVSFHYRSLAMAYAVCLYLVSVPFVCISIKQHISTINIGFENMIFQYVIFNMLWPYFLVPFTMWMAAKSISQLLQAWTDYQNLYFHSLGKQLVFNVRQTCINKLIIHIMSMLSLFTFKWVYPEATLSNIVAIVVSSNMVMLTSNLWECFCRVLMVAGCTLGDDFKNDPRILKNPSIISEYRKLWCKLSKLCQQAGNALCYSNGSMNIMGTISIVLGLYGVTWKLSTAQMDVQMFILCIGSILGFIRLWFIYNSAHQVTTKVTRKIKEEIQNIPSVHLNQMLHMEVSAFITTIECNPVSIQLGGYLLVNRHGIIKTLSTLLTYLIVLIQLRMGEKTQ